MHRLFLALRPPEAIRIRLLDLMSGVPGARWQADEQLHLTVRFIGEVERPIAEDIGLAFESFAAPAAEVTLDGVGRFDSALWAGVAPHDALAAIHRKADHLLVRLGLTAERRAYLPHVTLARMGRSAAQAPETARWLAEHAALRSAPFALDTLILYESELGRGGASYRPVMRYPLARGAAGPGTG